MTTISFNPDPATTDAILQAIAADYSLSLTDIAAQHQTTIEALTAWLTREDIDERLAAIESACARRARLTAANHLPAVAHVAKQALEEASDVLRLPPDYRTQRSIALRIRATESARRAAALLLRIANFTPGPRRIRLHAAPTTLRITPLTATITAPPTECAPAAPAAPADAPRAESTRTAPTEKVATDRALSVPTAATPNDHAQPAPISLPPAESTISAPSTNSTQSALHAEPATVGTHAAPNSTPSARHAQLASTSAPISAPAPRPAPTTPPTHTPPTRPRLPHPPAQSAPPPHPPPHTHTPGRSTPRNTHHPAPDTRPHTGRPVVST